MQPILKINLSNRKIDEFFIPSSMWVDFLGGASLGARLLYDELLPGLDPLSPEASLLFINGPLSGTSGPAVGRFVVCAKSPLTGFWGESNCGGFWGPELRMAGYFGLWIKGRADSPVYITINNGEVDILPADDLWGMDTYTTQAAVKSKLEVAKPRVAVIGPAGEAMIPFSVILTDHGRVAGRTGMGAVMGSKNLKAIAVKGNGKVPVVDPENYASIRSKANRELITDTFSEMMHDLGTAGGVDYMDYIADMPKKYYQRGVCENACNISGASIAETILAGSTTCHACVIACGRVVRLADGEKRKGPEYETLAGFGPNLLYDNPSRITLLGELCDRYGMDTISLSNTIGLVMKLNEMGVIPRDTYGYGELEWGDPDVMERLIHQTVRKEGLGKLIAKGSRELAKYFGYEEEAVQVNGLETAYHDPRGASGMALVYATSPRGACHNQSDYFLIDIGQVLTSIGMEAIDRQAGAEKAKNVAIHQNWRTLSNSLVICLFANVPPETVLELINAACGLQWDCEDMLRAGERGWNLKRVINHRLGLTKKNDRLPKAFLQSYEDHPAGADGFIPDFENMLQDYYATRGWDSVTGFPTKEKLISLGLEWLVEDIW